MEHEELIEMLAKKQDFVDIVEDMDCWKSSISITNSVVDY